MLDKEDIPESTYLDLINLIKQICNYIIPSKNSLKGKVDNIMGGGKVLELESERLLREGMEKGIFSCIQDGYLSLEYGAKKLGISVEECEKRMVSSGYAIPSTED